MWGWWFNIFKKPAPKMKDAISRARIEKLHPVARDDFRNFIIDAEQSLGITLRVTQGLRTFAEQDELFSRGRTKFYDEKGNKLGVVTNARSGGSYHQYGLAIDLVELKNGKPNWNFNYRLLLPHASKYFISWGGEFKSIQDKPHFEKRFGLHWTALLDKYKNKYFIPDTEYVIIP